jgi:hypothetical protein
MGLRIGPGAREGESAADEVGRDRGRFCGGRGNFRGRFAKPIFQASLSVVARRNGFSGPECAAGFSDHFLGAEFCSVSGQGGARRRDSSGAPRVGRLQALQHKATEGRGRFTD